MVTMPSWDLFIALFFITIVAYGFILQREKVTVTLLSTYVGMVVASVWGKAVYEVISGNTVILNQVWLRSGLSLFATKMGIFIIFLVALSLKGEFSNPPRRMMGIISPILLLVYSFLNAGLIISAVINFMSVPSRASLIAQSTFVDFIMRYETWWVVLPPIIMILAGFKQQVRPTGYPEDERRY